MSHFNIEETCRYLESVVENQNNTILVLNNKLENLTQVVYQMINGLYNIQTQEKSFLQLICLINPDYTINPDTVNTSNHKHWPTTKQGDANEKKLRLIEEYLYNKGFEMDEDNVSLSTHSSMPDLISVEGLDNEGLDNEGLDNEGLDNEGLDNEGLDNEGLDDNVSVSTHSSMPDLIYLNKIILPRPFTNIIAEDLLAEEM